MPLAACASAARIQLAAATPKAMPTRPRGGPLIELITALVEEGHAPNGTCLRRVEQLRGLVESGTARRRTRPGSAGRHVSELVHADVFPTTHRRHPAHRDPRRRAVAARRGDTVAERGRATPTFAPRPASGPDVVLLDSGPDATAMSRCAARSPRRTGQTAATTIGIGVPCRLILTILGFAGSAALRWVIGIIVLLIGVGFAVSAARAVPPDRAGRAGTTARRRIQRSSRHRARRTRTASGSGSTRRSPP